MIWATVLLALQMSVPKDCLVSATGVADAFYSGRKEVCGKPLTKGDSSEFEGDVYGAVYVLHVEERAYELRVSFGHDGKREVDEVSIKLLP